MLPDLRQKYRIAILCSVFAVLLATGICLTIVAPPRPIPLPKVEPIHGAVRTLASAADLSDATSAGQTILFVNCDWNVEVALFRDSFYEFAIWCRNNTAYLPASVTLHVNGDDYDEDEVWSAIQEIWNVNHIDTGTLKTLGGGGRVVWFEGGEIRDYAWYSEVTDVADLIERTEFAFDSAFRTPLAD